MLLAMRSLLMVLVVSCVAMQVRAQDDYEPSGTQAEAEAARNQLYLQIGVTGADVEQMDEARTSAETSQNGANGARLFAIQRMNDADWSLEAQAQALGWIDALKSSADSLFQTAESYKADCTDKLYSQSAGGAVYMQGFCDWYYGLQHWGFTIFYAGQAEPLFADAEGMANSAESYFNQAETAYLAARAYYESVCP